MALNDDPATHWDAVYRDRLETALTWFEAEPELSMELIRRNAGRGDAVLDVGGGASRLPDLLLAAGYGDIAVLDLSAAALGVSKARLGMDAGRIEWLVADVTAWAPHRRYRLWHDRAVFHFLTSTGAQDAYLRVMWDALAPGGHAIIATFAEDGPEMCSGLPVVRYAPDALAARIEAALPGRFDPVEAQRHVHVTPLGREQRFQVSVFRRL
jgi:SAM-dependent methyltransferase